MWLLHQGCRPAGCPPPCWALCYRCSCLPAALEPKKSASIFLAFLSTAAFMSACTAGLRQGKLPGSCSKGTFALDQLTLPAAALSARSSAVHCAWQPAATGMAAVDCKRP